MTTEIERKWMLDQLPDATQLGAGVPIRQGYLAEEGDVSARVRITPKDATLTVKAGTGQSRTEVELPISPEQADALWPHTANRRIVKTRYRVTLDAADGLVAEVDDYDEALAGLLTVEVEFPSDDAATAFEAPAWFGREVTGAREWTNAALARNGRPTP